MLLFSIKIPFIYLHTSILMHQPQWFKFALEYEKSKMILDSEEFEGGLKVNYCNDF